MSPVAVMTPSLHPPPCREGVTLLAQQGNDTCPYAGDFPGARSAQLHRSDEAYRKATPDVALVRECPRVPKCVPALYPRRSEPRQPRQQDIPVCRAFLQAL